MSFVDTVKPWIGYFNLLGEVTASFAGLLFVALALNASKFKLREHRHVYLLARQTFSNLLVITGFSLLVHMPLATGSGVSLSLMLSCIAGIVSCGIAILEERKIRADRAMDRDCIRAYYAPLGIYLLLAIPTLVSIFQGIFSLELLAVGLMFLLISSARNAWLLLFILE